MSSARLCLLSLHSLKKIQGNNELGGRSRRQELELWKTVLRECDAGRVRGGAVLRNSKVQNDTEEDETS